MWDLAIEKLENHKYRLYVKWDRTEKMLGELMEDGYIASDVTGVYYSDYDDDSLLFQFGMSMCECFHKLVNNRLFRDDYLLYCIRQRQDAGLVKEVKEKTPPFNLFKTMVDLCGMEDTLYLCANNYESIIKEAFQQYQNLDEVSFMDWLKDNIEPRFTTPVSSEIISRYLSLKNLGLDLSGLYCGYWAAWQDVRDNWEGYLEWVNNVEFTGEVDFEIIESLINHEDNIKKQFYIVYFYGYKGLANILFGMLNDPGVLFKVKEFVQIVLLGSAKKDPKFAETLQMLYSGYKSIAGGIDIDFAQQVFENEMLVFPEDDIKYHLSHDLYDEDKGGFIGMINPIYNDPENLTRVFKELVKFKWVRPNELDTFVYRFTGKRKSKMIIDKIHWDGPIGDLLYLFKKFYGGSYGRIELFFDVKLDIAPKYYSSYADRPSPELKDLFQSEFGIKNS